MCTGVILVITLLSIVCTVLVWCNQPNAQGGNVYRKRWRGTNKLHVHKALHKSCLLRRTMVHRIGIYIKQAHTHTTKRAYKTFGLEEALLISSHSCGCLSKGQWTPGMYTDGMQYIYVCRTILKKSSFILCWKSLLGPVFYTKIVSLPINFYTFHSDVFEFVTAALRTTVVDVLHCSRRWAV